MALTQLLRAERQCCSYLKAPHPCTGSYLKLLTLALRAFPKDSSYWFKGALYRGLDTSKSPLLREKYDNYATSFVVGTIITFPAPTSFSICSKVAGSFTKGIQIVWTDGEGVRLKDLSAFIDEDEVLVEGPSQYQINAVYAPTSRSASASVSRRDTLQCY